MPSDKGPWGRRPTWRRVIVIDRSKLQRTIGGTAVGNFMEWYDFGIFAFLATTLATVFFPQGTTVALQGLGKVVTGVATVVGDEAVALVTA